MFIMSVVITPFLFKIVFQEMQVTPFQYDNDGIHIGAYVASS